MAVVAFTYVPTTIPSLPSMEPTNVCPSDNFKKNKDNNAKDSIILSSHVVLLLLGR